MVARIHFSDAHSWRAQRCAAHISCVGFNWYTDALYAQSRASLARLVMCLRRAWTLEVMHSQGCIRGITSDHHAGSNHCAVLPLAVFGKMFGK